MRRSPLTFLLLTALVAFAPPTARAVGDPPVECPDGRCTGRAPAYRDTAYTNHFPGRHMAVGTMQGFAGTDAVVSLFDLTTNIPALNTNWAGQYRYTGVAGGSGFGGWQLDTLGTVFGLTLDDTGNIYACASSAYNGDAVGQLSTSTPGSVYKIDRQTGFVSVFANLPNSPDPAWISSPSEANPCLGNITYDPVHNKLFVTNMEDGMIYRLDMNGTISGSYDPFGPDNGLPGWAPLGERIWAVQWHTDNKLYFSRWNSGLHEVWAMQLDGSGNFVPATETLVITVPLAANFQSYPISDITFTKQGHLLLAERQMYSDSYVSAHAARLLEYTCDLNTWYLTPAVYSIGNYIGPPYNNSAGGVDSDYRNYTAGSVPGRYWVTGDALHLFSNDYIYGAQGFPPGGGSTTNSFLFDYNGNVLGGDKFELGDIEITCPVDTGSIHGGKFQDLDCDGKFDQGEPGLANWPIVVSGPTGTFTIYTQANGSFHLWGLPNGTYTLCELGQAGWNQTMPASGCYTVVVNGNVTTGQLFGNCRPCEVQQPPCVKIPNTAVMWLPFDETGGHVVHDPAGSNPGQIVGDASLIVPIAMDKGLRFRQQGHYVRVPHSLSLDFGAGHDFSAAASFLLDNVAGAHFLFDKRVPSAAGPKGWSLSIENGCVVVRMQAGTATPVYVSSPVVSASEWHSVALSVSQSSGTGLPPTGTVYLDGSSLGTFDPMPTGTPIDFSNTGDLFLGTNAAATSVFGGQMDEPMLFARAINVGDVGIIWNPWILCKQWCKVPPTVNFGPYATTATATFTICNYDWSQPFMNYSWSLAGLPAGTCSVNGPVTYSPSSGSMNIPAGSCQSVTVTITRPSWLVPGTSGCFVFNVTNNTNHTCFNCTSIATASKKWWVLDPIDWIGVGHGTSKQAHFTVTNADPVGTSRVLVLSVRPGRVGDSPQAQYISLNGLPPGEPVIFQRLVEGGGSTEVDVQVSYPVWSHLPDQWLTVDVIDEEGDLEPTTISSTEILLEDGAVLAAPPAPQRADVEAVTAWPNPARGATHVRLSLTKAARVDAAVYDLAGRTVRRLQRGTLTAGAHDFPWDGRDGEGRPVESGLYFIRMTADGREYGTRLILMR